MITSHAPINLVIKINRMLRYILAVCLYLTILNIFELYLHGREYYWGLLRQTVQSFLSGILFLCTGKLPIAELHHYRDDNGRNYCRP